MDSDSGGRWLHYDEAASVLGITKASVRQKCIRGKLRRMHGNDGRSLVLVPDTASGTASNDVSDGVSNRVDTPLRTPSVQVTLAAALDELKAQLSAAAERETRRRRFFVGGGGIRARQGLSLPILGYKKHCFPPKRATRRAQRRGQIGSG